ncbi:Crp/Fnr family transcriptional regulator [Planctomycetaceae bacterium]|jgi:CRP/FNR family transcriptional regulator, cyclic AMP receptor protein|nr:Crp/Fnr family transcriptional regulator [bacterium]MDC0261967.1 Crp/Fnr family transcriptional regulator [Planctomycetaceae bacterium]MDG2388533.1 Crp/Fnr family transcriptional regulator [Planctomycetaceae bacterium]
MEDKFWFLKQCSLFEKLSPSQIEQVESQSRMRKFTKASLVYLPSDQSDSVLLLISGRIKLYHLTPDGKQALLALIDPGELFGELAILEGGTREEFAEAMEASQVVAIPRNVIHKLMESHAEVSLGVTRLLGLRRRRVERRLKSLLFRSNRERLVHLLVELLEKYGEQEAEGVRIAIRLSHQDLANIIGSTRETVTVLLGELGYDRLLLIKKRKIYVPNPARLAESIGLAAPVIPTE